VIELNRTEHYLNALEASLRQEIARRGFHNPVMIGIHRGGVWIAERLHQSLGLKEPLGRIDISFYRDDFSRAGLHPTVQASSIPVAIDGRDIILIDDVFYTGRTVRAGLNELFDYGRPNQVILGALIERNGREIPIRPDCIGGLLSLSPGERIKLSGPSPLVLSVHVVAP
jgi:pyrimidine operon attenuation protein/uracil phosphoribosyltransferase